MVAVSHSARCFCGRSQSLVRGCLFHAGDLELRVGRLMRSLRVVDTETGDDLSGGRKWLAFVVASIGWHLLPWVRLGHFPAVAEHDAAKQLGDLAVAVDEDAWLARQAITAEELAALHAEAVIGNWPFSELS